MPEVSAINECRVCLTVFKSKNELQLHTRKSHNVESLSTSLATVSVRATPSSNKSSSTKALSTTTQQQQQQQTVPFRCWFCVETFVSPEEVVAHMTNHHDNLDNLSRIVTDATTTTNITSTSNTNISNNTSYNTTTKFTNSSSTTSTASVVADMKSFSKLKHLKRSLDASLSPVDVGHACPKCPKKLGSKEAFELHLMAHKTVVVESEQQQEHRGVHNNQEQHNDDLMMPLRQKGGLGREVSVPIASSNIYEIPLSGRCSVIKHLVS